MSDRGLVWDPDTVVLLPSGLSLEEEIRQAMQEAGGEAGEASASKSSPSDESEEGPPLAAPASRHLRVCRSRGSCLAACETEEPEADDASGPLSSSEPTPPAAHPPALRPRVITNDPCPWAWFRGQWGQTDAPIVQGWYARAECPVSRTSLLRLLGHFVGETDSIV